MNKSHARVTLHPHGLNLSPGSATPTVLPLYAGTMHYWRHHPAEWAPGLEAMRALGVRVLDTYVPWQVHERERGVFDFGEKDPYLDVSHFITLAGERDLKVIVRPGPHINAELTHFGLPERVVWNRDCQARTPKDNPVILPMIPLAFPVPSYASQTFMDETAIWFEAVAPILAPLRHPEGPIVLTQIDNEGALYFRDGPYDQDYHPDAIALFRTFLKQKYRTLKAMRAAWSNAETNFASVMPPTRMDAKTTDDLVRHLDWMEFHEHLLAHGIGAMARLFEAAGFDGVPTMHNFPMGESATPLNAARMTADIDLVALDYYQGANPRDHMTVMRRTSDLAVRSTGRNSPPYAAEIGAGFPPFFAPLDEEDSLYGIMCGLAYGLRGFNLYMAVERDRWVGAPIDRHGTRRPFGDKLQALFEALEKSEFHTLTRKAPVRLVVPRALRRLARATHAFGPLTPAAFHVMGGGFRESCLEDDFDGSGEPAPIEGEAYLRAFERALMRRGVPFAYVAGETLDDSIQDASWIICATAGGLKRELIAELRAASKRGMRVTIGPRVPDHDGNFRVFSTPLDVRGLELEPLADASRADALVARRIEELKLPTHVCDPADAFVSIHEDANGNPRVLFVMNPSSEDLVVHVSIAENLELEDLMSSHGPIRREAGGALVPVKARTIRMLRCRA